MKTAIAHIDGIGAITAPKIPTTTDQLVDAFSIDQIPADLFDMVLLREQKALLKGILSKQGGVSNSTIQLDGDIDALDEGIRAFLQGNGNELILIGEQHDKGGFSYAQAGVSGIGASYDKMREQRLAHLREQRLNLMLSGATISGYSQIGGIGKFFKRVGSGVKKVAEKVGQGAKKVGKAIVNVVTFPIREIAKLAIRIFIPGMSPFFLYIFTPSAGLPDKVAKKRAKALKIKGFIVGKLKMRSSTFDGLIRNGIMKKMGKTPEQAIAEYRQGLSGIGAVWVLPAIQALIALIKKLTNKPPADISAQDAPDPSDWQFEDILETANDVITPIMQESSPSLPASTRKFLQSGQDMPFKSSSGASTGIAPTGFENFSQPQPDNQSEGGNNLLVYGALALGAFLLLKK